MRAHLGQHFLTHEDFIKRIVSSLKLSDYKAVVEVGPGRGALTVPIIYELNDRYGDSARYIGIERDSSLANTLTKTFSSSNAHISFIDGDARKELENVFQQITKTHKSFVLVGNIPYYITGFFVRLLSSIEPRPKRIVLTMQREVAERITAHPPHMNMLSASVQCWAHAEILFHIPKTAFLPSPEVHSSVIALTPNQQITTLNEYYYKTLKILFGHPRKTLINNLRTLPKKQFDSAKEKILELGLTNHTRSQELSIEIIKKISKIVYN